MAKQPKKGDTMNIQSFIRLRPLGLKEKRASNFEFGNREVVIKTSDCQKTAKSYNFDRVFQEDSKQVAVYSTIVQPLINEVIKGYNCTVFAYGQTGTGKTYTMCGPQEDASASLEDGHAGIIPRALEDIFTELSGQNFEYQVSVSYMELYNEKLRNLLNSNDEDINVKLIDDLEGGVILKGLSPTPVKARDEAFQLLQKGAEKKQVAATLMNLNSSRSHTIFTINVNIKENVLGKEDVLRLGKLHLIDLAGSENVCKSGASEKTNKSSTGVNKRLAEASNINKSLLTLGRVITSITENNPHVPYRESKLTRLLRDSLGGKTKTCIIGTVSPCSTNADETESTLNYASKARFIKNNPEKNKTISRKDFMQDASAEILKLKRDLEAIREGDGFYISKETHDEMILRMQELDRQVSEWYARYNNLNDKFEQHKELYSTLRDDYEDKCAEYEESVKMFDNESKKLSEEMSEVRKEIIVREYFIKEYQKTEKNLTEQAKLYKSVLQNVLEQSGVLHDNISRKEELQNSNVRALNEFKENVTGKVVELTIFLLTMYHGEQTFLQSFRETAGHVLDLLDEEKVVLQDHLKNYQQKVQRNNDRLMEYRADMMEEFKSDLDGQESIIREKLFNRVNAIESFAHIAQEGGVVLGQKIFDICKRSHFMIEGLNKVLDMCCDPTRLEHSAQAIKTLNSSLLMDIGQLMTKIDLSSTFVHKSYRSADVAQKKLEKLTDEMLRGFNDLFDTINSIRSNSLAGWNELQTTREVVSNLPITVQKMSEATNVSMKELEEKIADVKQSVVGKVEDAKMLEIVSLSLRRTILDYQSKITRQVYGLRSSLSDLEETHRENKKSTMTTFKAYSEQIKVKTENAQRDFDLFLKDCDSMISGLDCFVDMELRNQSDELQHRTKKIDQFQSSTLKDLDDIRETVKKMDYELYKPQGTTPLRMKMSDFNCPDNLHSTAPRDVLKEKFIQEQEKVGSPSSQTSSGSSDIVTSVRNLPLIGSECRMALRRSTSLPNVQDNFKTSDEEFFKFNTI